MIRALLPSVDFGLLIVSTVLVGGSSTGMSFVSLCALSIHGHVNGWIINRQPNSNKDRSRDDQALSDPSLVSTVRLALGILKMTGSVPILATVRAS
jgi:hypothetical protein